MAVEMLHNKGANLQGNCGLILPKLCILTSSAWQNLTIKHLCLGSASAHTHTHTHTQTRSFRYNATAFIKFVVLITALVRLENRRVPILISAQDCSVVHIKITVLLRHRQEELAPFIPATKYKSHFFLCAVQEGENSMDLQKQT
jgi:hypothetical protein